VTGDVDVDVSSIYPRGKGDLLSPVTQPQVASTAKRSTDLGSEPDGTLCVVSGDWVIIGT